MRTSLTKLLLGAALAGGLMAGGAAFAQPNINTAPCSTPGVVKASISTAVAETFIVPFAANSSELSPVAERVLEIAAVSYPQQPVLYFRVQGAEPAAETEALVKIDRLAWITVYLSQRDVPLEAIVFEEPSMAQRMGCAGQGQASL
jgi:hypothetical protein